MIRKVKLDELCTPKSSNLAQKDILENYGEYPVYGASGFIKKVDFYHQEKEYIAVIKDGAGIGRTSYMPPKSSIIGTMQYLIPKSNVYPKYLYYAVKAMNLAKYYSGATIPHIYFKDYKKELVPLYSDDKQKVISFSLEKLENIISLKQQQLSEYDQLIKSRFVDMFGDSDSNDKKWSVLRIKDIATCVAGATPSTLVNEYWENGTIPWMSSGEVNKGRIFETEKKITELGYSNASTRLVPPKTVVLAMAGQGKTRGTPAITEIELCTNQSICSLVSNGKTNSDFLYHLLLTQYENLRNESNGSGGRGGLNLAIIGNYKIIVPPIVLQNQFSTFVQQVNKLKFEDKFLQLKIDI
jgi:type I restriction enzyme S subunit